MISKVLKLICGAVLAGAVAAGAWIVFFHSDWIKPAAKPEDPEPETDVAVRTVKIARASFHRYVECYGTVGPELRRLGGNEQSASARVVSSVAGVVAEVHCVGGQRVEKGALLFQLDERIAKSEESKAEAALASVQATLAKLKASTRPEQIAVAEIALKKARQAVEFALQADARQKGLAKDNLVATKQLEESAQQLAAAREDQITAEKQLTLLKNSPAPEELAEAAAKITESEKALAAAHLQRSLLTIKAPISGTVIKMNVIPGDPVDTTVVLAELIDMNRLEVSAAVPAAEMKWLKVGQPLEIRCPTSGQGPEEKAAENASAADTVIKGSVVAIGMQLDAKTDTVTVRAALPPDSGVRPGQAARLKITVEEHKDQLAVPEGCVFRDKVGIDVIAVVENDKSSLQNVNVGLHENGLVEISGKEIKEGDVVVAAGANGFPEETKVHVVGAPPEKSR